MVIVGSDTVQRRERLVQPIVLGPGLDHGGQLDLVVLVGDRPEDVVSAASNLSAAHRILVLHAVGERPPRIGPA